MHTAVRSHKADFDYLIFQFNNLPNNHIARTPAVDMTMVEVRRAHNSAVVAPTGLYRPFLLQVMFQGEQDITQFAGKFCLLLFGAAGEINPPRRFAFFAAYVESLTKMGILSRLKYLFLYILIARQ